MEAKDAQETVGVSALVTGVARVTLAKRVTLRVPEDATEEGLRAEAEKVLGLRSCNPDLVGWDHVAVDPKSLRIEAIRDL